MPIKIFSTSLLAALALSGCSADIEPSRDFDSIYFAGTQDPNVSANGLAFADGTQSLSDVENKPMTIRLVRYESDPVTGEVGFVVTGETANLGTGATTSVPDNGVVPFDGSVTLDGATLSFVDGVATLPTGQEIMAYVPTRLEHSGTIGLYAISDADNPALGELDIESIFSVGHETNPAIVDGMTGDVTFAGVFRGYTQIFDASGQITERDVKTTGAVQLVAEFSQSRISGQLVGQLFSTTGDKPYELIFLGAPITGNGFVGVADLTCPSANSCTSNTSVNGVFFGDDGQEVSGAIALDETISGPDGYGFKGTAGFSSTKDAPAD